MLRVPWSLNSNYVQFDNKGRIIDIPYESRVRIVKHWDGNTPSIKCVLLIQYRIWLQFATIRDIREQRIREEQHRKYRHIYGRARERRNYDYDYIEKLLDKPLDDHRIFCIWRVLAHYLINVKGLSRQDAFNIISSWLDKCNAVCRLKFNPRQKISDVLRRVGSYYPISRTDLEQDNRLLFQRLKNEGIV
jgi:hypothetical protein